MRQKKGFTLVELLAMLVILGILMVVAIPNITGILGNQRVNSLKADAQNLIETARIKIAKDGTIAKPQPNQCLFFTLDSLDDNDDFSKGPNGGDYERYESFVIAIREQGSTAGTTKYNYYVRLLEKVKDTDTYTGIDVLEESKIKDIKNKDIKTITTLGLNADKNNSLNILKAQYKSTNPNPPKCNETQSKYYTRLKRCVHEGTDYFDQNGNPTNEATWISQCRKCIVDEGKYYGISGNEVSAATYVAECN